METIRTVLWMKELARKTRAENHLIGLVPTMGAVHEGHLSLVRRARKECSKVFTSLFVNPKQFGPQEDFAKYPRTLEADLEKFSAAGVDGVFMPEASDMYPKGFLTYVNADRLSECLEGRSRPGHFRGVTTVVLKLFQIVQPHFAYFGRKDAQQVRVIQQMVRDLNLDVEIVLCPIVREADGLALSSRNAYLSSEERRAATVLYRALDVVRREIALGMRETFRLQETVRETFSREPLAALDYVEIVDLDSFEPVTRISRGCFVLLAAFVGSTRLIDNLLIEPGTNPDELLCFL